MGLNIWNETNWYKMSYNPYKHNSESVPFYKYAFLRPYKVCNYSAKFVVENFLMKCLLNSSGDSAFMNA